MRQHSHEDAVDLAVIGAGPCGLAAGIAARRAGLSCVLFDKECVAASISRYPTHMTFFSTAERLEIGGVPFVVAGEKPTRREALRYYQRLAREYALDVHQYERVTGVSGGQDDFRIETVPHREGARTTRARDLVIATGYFDSPNPLGIPGEDLPKVAHNYREGHVFYDQDCVVIGGGNSAVDAALELHRWGARVTIVHFAPALDPNVKPWVRPEIEARIRDGDIAALFDARVTAVHPASVVVRQAGAEQALPNDWVLAMTGYTPDGDLLRGLGVEFDPETGIPRHDPGTMETNVPGVFIAGVLSAGYNANKVFIENGRDHGARIVECVKNRVDTLRGPG
jgi:thioredoxin reductase (NADPH)